MLSIFIFLRFHANKPITTIFCNIDFYVKLNYSPIVVLKGTQTLSSSFTFNAIRLKVEEKVYNSFTAVSQHVVIEKLMQFRVSPVGGNRRWKNSNWLSKKHKHANSAAACDMLPFILWTKVKYMWNSLQCSLTHQISKCSIGDDGALPCFS